MNRRFILVLLLAVVFLAAVLTACLPGDEPSFVADLGFELDEEIAAEWFHYSETFVDYELVPFQEEAPYLIRAALDSEWEESRYGYIDESGELIIPLEYDEASSFYNGLALASNEDGTFFITPDGGQVLDVSQYDEIRWHSDDFYNYTGDLIVVGISGLNGVISISGEEVLPCQFENIYIINDDLFEIKNGEACALFDRSGNALTGFEYQYIGRLSDGRMLASRGEEQWGFLDAWGNEAIPFEYRSAGAFSEGLAPVQVGFLWGFIDVEGHLIISPQYTTQGHFSEGLALVQRAGENFYINTDNEVVIPVGNGQYSGFANGIASVSEFIGNVYAHTIIDQWGGIYLPPKEYRMYYLGEGLYMGTFDAYDGTGFIPPSDHVLHSALVHENGSRLTTFSATSIGRFKSGLAVRTSRTVPMVSGIINKHGAEILPPVFSTLYLHENGSCLVYAQNFSEDGPENVIGLLKFPENIMEKPNPDSDFLVVFLNDTELFFSPAPTVAEGQVLLPVNQLMAKLGAEMLWNPDTMVLTCTAEGVRLEIIPDSASAMLNGTAVELSAPVELVDNCFWGPMSIVTDAFGLTVSWDDKSRDIILIP